MQRFRGVDKSGSWFMFCILFIAVTATRPPDLSTRTHQTWPNVFGNGYLWRKAGRGDVVTAEVNMLSAEYSDGSVPQQQKFQYGCSLAHVHWKNPLQWPHYSSYTIKVSQMTTRGWQKAALGLMHTHKHIHRGEEGGLGTRRPDHSSNRPSRMLSNEKGKNLKPWPQ